MVDITPNLRTPNHPTCRITYVASYIKAFEKIEIEKATTIVVNSSNSSTHQLINSFRILQPNDTETDRTYTGTK